MPCYARIYGLFQLWIVNKSSAFADEGLWLMDGEQIWVCSDTQWQTCAAAAQCCVYCCQVTDSAVRASYGGFNRCPLIES